MMHKNITQAQKCIKSTSFMEKAS